MGAIHEIVFDCAEPSRLAAFWLDVLEGYAIRDSETTDVAIAAALGLDPATPSTVIIYGPGPSLCFQNVSGQRPDNNRVHVDINVTKRGQEVERLKQAGATVDRVLPTYTVMRDPEGNQFCLVDQREAMAA